jgi:hypothetical protein
MRAVGAGAGHDLGMVLDDKRGLAPVGGVFALSTVILLPRSFSHATER